MSSNKNEKSKNDKLKIEKSKNNKIKKKDPLEINLETDATCKNKNLHLLKIWIDKKGCELKFYDEKNSEFDHIRLVDARPSVAFELHLSDQRRSLRIRRNFDFKMNKKFETDDYQEEDVEIIFNSSQKYNKFKKAICKKRKVPAFSFIKNITYFWCKKLTDEEKKKIKRYQNKRISWL